MVVKFNRVRFTGTSVGGEVWSTHLDFAVVTSDTESTAIESEGALLTLTGLIDTRTS